MLIKSDRFTNRIKKEDGSLEYLSPGSEFEVSEDKGREKIAAGRAELAYPSGPVEVEASGSQPPPSNDQTNQGSTGQEGVGPGTSDAGDSEGSGDSQNKEFERLQEAILNLDSEVSENFLQDGRPTVEAVSKELGQPVTAAERDAAWDDLQDD